ncbi:MAG: hypothetical protein RIC55_36260 [Pirellulaceae bacterium]
MLSGKELNDYVRNFDREHGTSVMSMDGTTLYYADGASREVDPRGVYELIPTADEHPYRGDAEAHSWEVLCRRERYYVTKVERCRLAYTNHRDSMFNTDYDNEQWRELKRLGRRLNRAKRELDEFFAERCEHPIYKRHQFQMQAQGEREGRIQEKNRKLNAMRV